MKAGRASPGASSHQFLWPAPPTSGRRTEDVQESRCWRLGGGAAWRYPRRTRASREEGVLSGGAGRGRCGASHDAPASRRLPSVGVPRAAGCICTYHGSLVALDRVQREGPDLVEAEGADRSGRSFPQTPYAGQMRDLAVLVPQLEVERGPAARLRKTILGAFSEVGLKGDPSLL